MLESVDDPCSVGHREASVRDRRTGDAADETFEGVASRASRRVDTGVNGGAEPVQAR